MEVWGAETPIGPDQSRAAKPASPPGGRLAFEPEAMGFDGHVELVYELRPAELDDGQTGPDDPVAARTRELQRVWANVVKPVL